MTQHVSSDWNKEPQTTFEAGGPDWEGLSKIVGYNTGNRRSPSHVIPAFPTYKWNRLKLPRCWRATRRRTAMDNRGTEKESASNGSVSKPDLADSILEVIPSNATDTSQKVADIGNIQGVRQQRHRQPAWVRFRGYMREPFAEFMGVFTLIIFGDGVVAQVVLSKGTRGDYQSINWGWGIGVMLGVYVAGLSGAHLNPAVTLANCVFRKFPWRKFLPYTIAQTFGAFMAAAVIYANYRSAIDMYEGVGVRSVGGETSTAGIFCTYPAPFMTTTGQFFSEFLASGMLMFVIFALTDPGNIPAGNLTPLILFFLIFGIGACLGWETGYAINLARDFGPRLFSWMAGYGTEVWTAGNYYFWIPMVAPFFGCLTGGLLYDLFIFTGDSPINEAGFGFGKRGDGQEMDQV